MKQQLLPSSASEEFTRQYLQAAFECSSVGSEANLLFGRQGNAQFSREFFFFPLQLSSYFSALTVLEKKVTRFLFVFLLCTASPTLSSASLPNSFALFL